MVDTKDLTAELTAAMAIIDGCREIVNCPNGVDLQDHLRQLAAENAALKSFGDKLNDMHNALNGEGTGIQGRAECLTDICYQHLHWIHDEEAYAKRVIVCAANKYTLTTGKEIIIPCVRHANPVLSQQIKTLMDAGLLVNPYCHPDDQGFIDQYYNWWNRADAFIIADNANQIDYDRNVHHRELFSEGLY